MNNRTGKLSTIADVGVCLLVTRAALPFFLTWLANRGGRKIPGYNARVLRIDLSVLTPSIAISGLSLVKLGRPPAQPVLEINSLIVSIRWRDLLHSSLIAQVRIESPRLLLDVRDFRTADEGGHDSRPTSEAKNSQPTTWQAKVMGFPAFQLSSAALVGGEVQLRGIPGQDGTDIKLSCINVSCENITNSDKLAHTLLTRMVCKARIMAEGDLQLRAEGYPLAEQPTFNVDFQTDHIDLTDVRDLIENNLEIEVRKGVLNLYVEAAASDGHIQGYAKPIFDHLELEPPRHSTFVGKLKAWAVEAVVKFGRNKRKDRVATRLDFEGSLNDPDLDITDAILRFIRNSFSTAERAALDHQIWFSRAPKTASEVEIHDGREPRSKAGIVFGLIKESFGRWSEDAAPRMAAALAYYTAFSMAPLLILAIAIAGLVLGREAAQGKIVEQIGGLVGKQSGLAIQSMIQAANHSRKGGIFAGVVSIVTLIAGATGVLSELKSALNKIWRTKEPGDVKEIVKKNVVFLGMVLGMGFLLTVSLIASAALSAAGGFLGGLLPAHELLLQLLDFALSSVIIALLFGAMYRFLPNATVEWRDVWVGATITSLLFNLGKLGIGLYLGKGAVGSSYGAAGSILVLLLWIYYSGLIFYFGAEFTKVYAERYGSLKVQKSHPTGARGVPRYLLDS